MPPTVPPTVPSLRSFDLLFSLVALGCFLAACGSTAEDYCSRRQDLWEHAFGDDDPEWAAENRLIYVPSCTQLLSGTDAKAELACRHRCLRAADRTTNRSSSEARAVVSNLQQCEVGCHGNNAASPTPTSLP